MSHYPAGCTDADIERHFGRPLQTHCPCCDETGRVDAEYPDSPAKDHRPSLVCPECKGTGFVDAEPLEPMEPDNDLHPNQA